MNSQHQSSTPSTSKRDPFHTPQNTQFYAAFHYPPLDPGAGVIRLLKVDVDSQRPHKLISNVSLAQAPRYTALSYCAGDPHQTRNVDVDGHKFRAFASLARAIDHARVLWKQKFPNREMFLWVDQICINQSDDTDRTLQVKLMHEIYSSAENVFISLELGIIPDTVGTSDDRNRRHKKVFYPCFHAHEHNSFWSNPDWTSLFDTISRFQTKDMLRALEESLPQSGSSGIDPASISPETLIDPFSESYKLLGTYLHRWAAAFAIVKSPWWRRAWIFQEFMMADRAYFLVTSSGQDDAFIIATWLQLQSFLEWHSIHLHEYIRLIDTGSLYMRERQYKTDIGLGIETSRDKTQQSFEVERYSDHIRSLTSKLDELVVRSKLRRNSQGVYEPDSPTRHEGNSKQINSLHAVSSKTSGQTWKWRQSDRAAQNQSISSEFKDQAVAAKELDERLSVAWRENRKFGEMMWWMEKLRAHQNVARDTHEDWQFVNNMRSTKAAADFPVKLSQLMAHASQCQASDPRDIVYAFLGLADIRYEIEPVYDVSVNTVRTRMTKAIVLTEKDLNFIAFARANDSVTTSDDPLPSWVPGTRTPLNDAETDYQRFREQAGLRKQRWQAAPVTSLDVSFRDDRRGNPDRVLEAQCLYVDTLGKLIYDDYDLLRRFEGRVDGQHLRISTPSNCRVGDEIWILLGANEPYVLRMYEDEATIVGSAMLEKLTGQGYVVSPIMTGDLYDRYEKGDTVVKRKLSII